MSRIWNCLDDTLSTSTAVDARALTAAVVRSEDKGDGTAEVTVELRDARRRQYNYVAQDSAVIDITISKSTTMKPDRDTVISSVGADATGMHGVGTAQVEVLPLNWSFKFTIDATASWPAQVYVAFKQGTGSTYLVRGAARVFPVQIRLV